MGTAEETGPAILVVDDSEDNRYALTRRLRREGYENVLVAENGRRAVEMLSRHPFQLVLLDIMMPELNGFEVLEHIKSMPGLRDVPVIMISALDDMDSVVRCIGMGAEDYLPKPFNNVLLRARVGACLEKKQLRDQEVLYMQRLQAERDRADALLHAILPSGAVKELKATNGVRPRRYEDVAVLFCDVVGFTAYCERYPPEKAVSELQDLVAAYEEIVEALEMEKIKTVGDAFIATAGLMRETQDQVMACLHCARSMVEAAEQMEPHWQVRVGVHCGPVVAGIMGTRQYLFDLWGDTVNTAARVMGYARPGSVLVSGSAWARTGGRLRGRSHGPVELKGKGMVELIEYLGSG